MYNFSLNFNINYIKLIQNILSIKLFINVYSTIGPVIFIPNVREEFTL